MTDRQWVALLTFAVTGYGVFMYLIFNEISGMWWK